MSRGAVFDCIAAVNLDVNVHNVNTDNAMDVNERNRLLSVGQIHREALWPRITEYDQRARTFRFTFGLEGLPLEPGIILICGPRQYGKSTWLELELRATVERFGPGSGYFLNGDELSNAADLERQIVSTVALFAPDARIRRLFIDEITAVADCETAIKRLADQGILKDVYGTRWSLVGVRFTAKALLCCSLAKRSSSSRACFLAASNWAYCVR